MTTDHSRLRLGLVALTALSLFGALFARLWFLQIVEGQDFAAQVTRTGQKVVVIPAPRGRILDRNGVVLVDNRPSIVVSVDTQRFDDLDQATQARVLDRLATTLNRSRPGTPLTAESIQRKLDDVRFSRFRPVPVATDVSVDEEIYFSEQAEQFPSVVVERETLRSYPYRSLAAHLLGYVGSLNADEYAKVRDEGGSKPYQRSDEIGKGGVEQAYEGYLRGTAGRRVYETDRRDRAVREVVADRQAPVAGDDVYLALDVKVQAETEISLRQGLEERRAVKGEQGNYPAEAGAAAIVDPMTGGVQAMASYPTYDPSQLVGGIECPVWRDINGLPAAGSCDSIDQELAAIPSVDRPLPKLVNRAIAGAYPPGSTFKLGTAFAALKLGLINPSTVIDDPGYYEIPNCGGGSCRVRSPSAESGGLGPVNLNTAITASSDTYFYTLGNNSWALYKNGQAGPTALQDQIRRFGIGTKTGVDLPGEKNGRLPDPAWLKQFDQDLNGEATSAGVWTSGTSINLAIGQGDVLVTPLQMANAYASFANGGTLYRPQVVDHITPSEQPKKILFQAKPEVIDRLDWDPAAYASMMDGFQGVTQDRPHATAKVAFEGFPQQVWPVAGKTGTAQSGTRSNPREDHSWFVGFGPTNQAQYSAAVVMEHSGSGGSAAAPAVRRILETVATNGLGAVDVGRVADPAGVAAPPPPASPPPPGSPAALRGANP